MNGCLGARIGEGAAADVHVWAPGRVVKLFKAGLPQRISMHEARMTRAIFSASALAPEVFDEIVVEGRFGFVMSRLEGPTLMQITKSGAIEYAEAGAVLAGVIHSVHKTPPPPEVPILRDYMTVSLRRAGDMLPKHIVTGILAVIDGLSPGDGLCHGDPHTGNVIMTVNGPRLIDWIGTMRAPAALDLALAHVVLCELAPEIVVDPQRPRAIHAAFQAAYAALAGVSPPALTVAMEPYLTIARMLLLLSGAVPAQRARLIQRLDANFVASAQTN